MPKNEEFLNIIMEYCKWRDDGASMISDDEGFGAGSSASTSQQHQQVNADSMDLMFKSQKQCVKNSIECKWHLAEAQQKLCSLELHNSESLEQEHAKAQADSSELRQTEQEWRHKEKMLIWGERQNPLLSNAFSREVFDKSFINIQSGNKEADEDRSKSFVQQYEEQLKHFGMLNRWDDSQRYLSDHSHLVCEETANYLLLWCFHLQADKSFINIQSGNKEADEDRSKSFVQQYEEQLKHFGMLNRWDDSQRYLSDHSHLVCEETANYLLLWCFHLQADKVILYTLLC
ncbi:UNVERIFIED_CONTAM: hypothetical protein FKN15_052207 [Acipenser sinensis]